MSYCVTGWRKDDVGVDEGPLQRVRSVKWSVFFRSREFLAVPWFRSVKPHNGLTGRYTGFREVGWKFEMLSSLTDCRSFFFTPTLSKGEWGLTAEEGQHLTHFLRGSCLLCPWRGEDLYLSVYANCRIIANGDRRRPRGVQKRIRRPFNRGLPGKSWKYSRVVVGVVIISE